MGIAFMPIFWRSMVRKCFLQMIFFQAMSVSPCIMRLFQYTNSIEVDVPVILFSQIPAENKNFVNKFSVNAISQQDAKGRTVVHYEGENMGVGTWTCTKDTIGDCLHKRLA
jgi:hypothetical protein